MSIGRLQEVRTMENYKIRRVKTWLWLVMRGSNIIIGL